jgi:hypothetical protein
MGNLPYSTQQVSTFDLMKQQSKRLSSSARL